MMDNILNKKLLAVCAAIWIAFYACACKDDGGQVSGEAASSDTASAAVSADTASADTEPAQSISPALEDGVLTVAVSTQFPPFTFEGEDGEPDGLDAALIEEAAKRIGVRLQFRITEYNSLTGAALKESEAAIGGLSSEAASDAVRFSDSYYETVSDVLVRADEEIGTYDDLKGRRLGCVSATAGEKIAEGIAQEDDATVCSRCSTAEYAVNDLLEGRIDALIIDRDQAALLRSGFPEELTAVDGKSLGFDVQRYAIAMPAEDEKLYDEVNRVLNEIREDGTLDRLIHEYLGGGSE